MDLKTKLSEILELLKFSASEVYRTPSPREGEVEARRATAIGIAQAQLESIINDLHESDSRTASDSVMRFAKAIAQQPTVGRIVKVEQPTVGRIVHYVLPDGPRAGEIRPAIIVRVWQPIGDASLTPGMSNLMVFQDQFDEFQDLEHKLRWKGSVMHCLSKTPGTWHWPDQIG